MTELHSNDNYKSLGCIRRRFSNSKLDFGRKSKLLYSLIKYKTVIISLLSIRKNYMLEIKNLMATKKYMKDIFINNVVRFCGSQSVSKKLDQKFSFSVCKTPVALITYFKGHSLYKG